MLSLLELNTIVRGFGWSFSPADSQGQVHQDAVWLVDNRWRSMFLTEQGPIIADACEEAQSRWCEPIREAIQNRHVLRVDINGFTLVD